MKFKSSIFKVCVTLAIGFSLTTEAQVSYQQRTQISQNRDVSNFLGNPSNNLARTKDAEIADINGDGFPDILDGNSNNIQNNTDIILRLNNGGNGFTDQVIGPRDNFVTYDLDAVDLNNDSFPDLIRTETLDGTRQISVYLNLRQAPWFSITNPSFRFDADFCTDDIDYGDINNDGLIDLVISERPVGQCATVNAGRADIFLNNGSGTFSLRQTIVAGPVTSTHDVFFADVEDDGDLDLFVINETDDSEIYLNNGQSTPSFTLLNDRINPGFSGTPADLNADGFVDFVIGSLNKIDVYLNDNNDLGSYQLLVSLPNADIGMVYDLELKDYDLDGDIDILAVSSDGRNNGFARIWLNNGGTTPAFSTLLSPFPNHGNYQRFSADAIDFDLDGDLDVYLTGGDDQSLGCFGCIPNQFYQSNISVNDTNSNFEDGLGKWIQGAADSHNWTRRSGPTSTGSSGPVRASSGQFYYYLETSSGSANNANNSAILESPTVSGSNRYAVFDYHMHGSDIGALHLDFFDGFRWINSVWSAQGEQQFENENPWLNARVRLPDTGLGDIRVRLRAVAAGGFAGDIAIDNVAILGRSIEIVNLPPVARNDSLTREVASDETFLIVQFNPLGNDTDPEGDSLRIVNVSGTGNQVISNSLVELRLVVGSNVATYTIEDSEGGRSTAQINSTLTLNQSPRANDDILTVTLPFLEFSTTVLVNPLTNDTDPEGGILRIVSLDRPSGQSGRIVNDSTVELEVRLRSSNTFIYTIEDDFGNRSTATIEINEEEGSQPNETTLVSINFGGNNGIGSIFATTDSGTERVCSVRSNGTCSFALNGNSASLEVRISEFDLPDLAFSEWTGCTQRIGDLTCEINLRGTPISLNYEQVID